MVQHNTAAAKLLRRGARVGNEQHRHVFVHHDFADTGDTLALERAVAHRQRLVNHQDLWVDRNRECKTQARLHAA